MTYYWICKKCNEWFRIIKKYHEDIEECFLCCIAEFEGWDRSKLGVNIDFEQNNRIRKHKRQMRIFWRNVARGLN